MSSPTFFQIAKFYFFIIMLPFVPVVVWCNTQRSVFLTIISTYLTLCIGMDYFLLQFLRIAVKISCKMIKKNDFKSTEKIRMERIAECKLLISHFKQSKGLTIIKNQEIIKNIALAYQKTFTLQKEELHDFYMFKALMALSRKKNLQATIYSSIALALIQEFKNENSKNNLIVAIREAALTSIKYTKWLHTPLY